MSIFRGPQKKGAKRIHKAVLREEAEARQASFEADVARIEHDQNISKREARRVAAESRHFARRKGVVK